MGFILRSAAPAALVLATSMVAEAGFVYSSASRAVSASVSGSVVDSESTALFGDWFGSANALSGSYSVLASQGSRLALTEMSFVGAAQIESSTSTALGALSGAEVFFTSSLTESITWTAGLTASTGGTLVLTVTDLATGGDVLAFSGPATGSGSFAVTAGREYRLRISARADAQGSGSALASFNAGFQSTIPAPATIVAFAGLAIGRRRRR